MRVVFSDGGRYLRNSGYGRVARSLLTGLCEIGAVTQIILPYNHEAVDGELGPIEHPKLRVIAPDETPASCGDLALLVGQPLSAKKYAIPTLMYTMVDVTGLTAKWQDTLANADGFLMPTEGMGRIFSKYFPNVYVAPLYVGNDVFKIRPHWRDEGENIFSFVFVGSFSYRKGVDTLLKAFTREFASNEARLTMICTETSPDRVFNKVQDYMMNEGRLANIRVITEPLSDAWLARMYSRHDCFVSFTRGEGFGYPFFEAARCGLPSLVPEGIQSCEFLDRSFNYFVESKHREVDEITDSYGNGFRDNYGGEGLGYIETTVPAAQAIMRKAWRNHNGTQKMGQQNCASVTQNYNEEKFIKALERALLAFERDGTRDSA
jgi:glycosyltransferase involved in cell wall biosynthesis